MKITVTGALGHIGSKLIRFLPEVFPHCEMTLIDNLLSQRYTSLFHLPKSAQYSFHEADICTENLASLFDSSDVIVHLAAITHPNKILTIDKMNEVNLLGTERVANACRELRIPLIFISTTNVYGKKEGLVDESAVYPDLNPQSPYAKTKMENENLIHSLEGLDFTIFRFGTVFGFSPGIQFQTAVQKFCWQAISQKPLTIWKTALQQKKPYLDLEDAVRVVSHAIQHKLFRNKTYNAVTTHQTVEHILEHIEKHIPNLKLEFVESKLMNELRYEVSRSKIEQSGFQFKGDLGTSIGEIFKQLPTYSMDSAPSEPSDTLC